MRGRRRRKSVSFPLFSSISSEHVKRTVVTRFPVSGRQKRIISEQQRNSND